MGGVRNVENEQVVTTRYSWTMSTCNKRVTLLVTDIPPQRSPYVSFFSLFSPLNMTKTKEKEQLSSPPSSERTHTHTHAQYRKISHRFDFEVIRSTRLDVAIKRSEHPGWAEPRLQQSSCFGCFHPSRHLPPIPRNVIQNPTVSYSHLAEALPSESNCIKCTLNIFLLSQICIKLNWIHRLRLAMLNASISALHGITEWICERWSWKIHSITITTPQITRRIPEEWSNPPHPANWPQRKTKENLQQLQRWAMDGSFHHLPPVSQMKNDDGCKWPQQWNSKWWEQKWNHLPGMNHLPCQKAAAEEDVIQVLHRCAWGRRRRRWRRHACFNHSSFLCLSPPLLLLLLFL